jgi:hypothetical protein
VLNGRAEPRIRRARMNFDAAEPPGAGPSDRWPLVPARTPKRLCLPRGPDRDAVSVWPWRGYGCPLSADEVASTKP